MNISRNVEVPEPQEGPPTHQFKPVVLYVLCDGKTERHTIDEPNTEIVLENGRELNISWLADSDVFDVDWDDEGRSDASRTQGARLGRK
jgi:hypothetical protein